MQEMVASTMARQYSIDNTPSVRAMNNLQKLCENILQPLRDRWGKPIVVSSGYRSWALNQKVGGSKNSDHMYGCAADIRCQGNNQESNKQLFDLAVEMMERGELVGVKQIIDECHYHWVHVSWQDGRTTKRNQVLHLK